MFDEVTHEVKLIGKNCFYVHNLVIYFKSFPILFANDKGGEELLLYVCFSNKIVASNFQVDPHS